MRRLRNGTFVVGLLLAIAGIANADEWSVQIGAFRSPRAGFADAAQAVGPVSKSLNSAGITRVQVGRYASEAEAMQAQDELRRLGYAGAYVVKKGVVKRGVANQPSSQARVESATSPRASDPGGDLETQLANVPPALRDRVVIVDGRLFIKEGQTFTPLEEYPLP